MEAEARARAGLRAGWTRMSWLGGARKCSWLPSARVTGCVCETGGSGLSPACLHVYGGLCHVVCVCVYARMHTRRADSLVHRGPPLALCSRARSLSASCFHSALLTCCVARHHLWDLCSQGLFVPLPVP